MAPHFTEAHDTSKDPSRKGSQADADVCSDAIAVIGFSIDFPSASSPDAFWDLVVSGRSAARRFPAERLNQDAWQNSDASSRGTIRAEKSYFLDRDIAAFDAPFFSITAAEAAAMDPQQRMLLETTYRALENAGIPLLRISGTDVSVFTGVFTADYLLLSSKDPERMPKYSATGFAGAMLSNRISTFFNVHGPSMTIDTACSSSLVALDMACQSLRRGESSLGIVTGCNLLYSLDLTIGLSNMGFLSPNGVCHSFDEKANGYARGEGVGALIIKPMSTALQDGDTIRAVIRASGTNQNGSTSLAQPSKEAQIRLIDETYRRAGLDMSLTNFVEAHGTGTAAGDPIEAMAIGEVFRSCRPKDDPLFIGASKANIGHLEGVSGLAGVVKTIQVLEKGVIPPIANLENLNSAIDSDFLNLEFPKQPIPWPRKGLRRASVNSFGFGGTNAHIVIDDAYHFLQEYGLTGRHNTIEEPPGDIRLSERTTNTTALTLQSDGRQDASPSLFVWSVADEQGLGRLRLAYESYLTTHLSSLDPDSIHDDESLMALASTLCERRSLLDWRFFAVANTTAGLIKELQKVTTPVKSNRDPKLGFVFTGQGAQWQSMGKELLVYPVFRRSLLEAEMVLQALGCETRLICMLSLPIRIAQYSCHNKIDEFMNSSKTEASIHDPRVSQPLCTMLQVALVDLLRSFNVTPAVVVGHSSGEIAAAYASGAISNESAWKLAYHRGVLSSDLGRQSDTTGAMMSVAVSRDTALTYIDTATKATTTSSICVACINSPSNVTLSGDVDIILSIKNALDRDGIFNRVLSVSVAYHSPQMWSIADEYSKRIGALQRGEQQYFTVPMISSVTGILVNPEELLRPSYWVQNLVSPVRFADAVKICCAVSGQNVTKKIDLSHRNKVHASHLLEIGPHSTLQGPIRQILNAMSHATEVSYASMIVRRQSAVWSSMQALGKLHCWGFAVNISAVNHPLGARKEPAIALPSLPEYPFDRSKTYWNESRISKNIRFRKHGVNNFLGAPVADWNELRPQWRHFLDSSPVSVSSWTRDHRINGEVLFPAAGMIVMALEAVTQVSNASGKRIRAYEIRETEFISGLTVPADEEGVETQIYLKDKVNSSDHLDSGYEFCIQAHRGGSTSKICQGSVKPLYDEGRSTEVDNGREEEETTAMVTSKVEACLSRFTKTTTGATLYNRLYKYGYHYGNSFQRIEKVQYDETNEAIGDISLFDDGSAPPTVIHPTTLDGILQMMLPAITKGGNLKVSTMIPTRLERLWISSTGLLANRPGQSIRSYASLNHVDTRTTESTIYAFEPESGRVLLSADGVQTKSVAEATPTSNTGESARKLCYNLVSKPDVSLMDRHRLEKLLASQRSQQDDPFDLSRDLQTFISALLAEVGQELSPNNIPRNRPHLVRQFAWIKERAIQNSSSNSTLEELYHRIQRHGRLGRIYSHFGRHLLGILRGEYDTLQVLSQENVLQDYYSIVGRSWKFNDSMKLYIELLSHKNPSMNIMEIGAGTGSTTKLLLESLTTRTSYGHSARFSRFDFTDVSHSFLAKAEEQFGSYPKVHFGIFDVENDPSKQGFRRVYDIIVAANVLHATKSLEVTLGSLRKLLKPGGKLLLIEPTQPQSLIEGFIFGCLPGWWQSTDEYRRNSPCITEQKWDEILRENGFSGTDMVFRDYDELEHHVSFMVSTAGEDQPLPKVPEISTRVVSGFGEVQASSLLTTVREQSALSDAQLSTFENAAEEAHLSEELVVIVFDPSWPPLDDLDDRQFVAFHTVLMKAKALFWVNELSNNPEERPTQSLITGLARTLRLERSGLIFTTLTISDGTTETRARNIQNALDNTLRGVETGVYEPELIAAEDTLTISRVYEDDELNQDVYNMTSSNEVSTAFGDKNLNLKIRSVGLLESLYFEEEKSSSGQPEPDEVEIEIKAVGVNLKDVLVATGHVNDSTFGTECSGIVSRAGSSSRFKKGDRVLASHLDTFRSSIRCKDSSVELVPEKMSFVEAASIPTNFITAYRALVDTARLSPGESVLIHAGAGGTGQAAIQVAQHCGATVFTTVGSNAKKELLMKLYGIPAEHILYSRDLSFAQGIKRLTNGEGVDVVLNSLSGQGLLASWESIAPYGRFVEIGKRDIISRRKLPMYHFAKNVTFSAIDIAAMGKERPKLVSKALRGVLELFKDGALQNVQPIKTFPIDHVEDAFRYLQSGKSSGKVIVEIKPQALVPAILESQSPLKLDDNCTYVVAGGLGGQGRSISRWLASKGARHLLLLSRSGAQHESALKFLNELSSMGVKAYAPKCDITDITSLKNVFDKYSGVLPHIRGCIQSTMVIRDVVFEKMSMAQWREVLLPKVTGSWNLHELLPQNMDFFIFLSSVSGIIGSKGQSNYAAANTFLDALALSKSSHGQNATSINLSAMESEGFFADNREVFDQVVNVKQLMPMSQPELFAILDNCCRDPRSRVQIVTGLELPSSTATKGVLEPSWMSEPMFSHLHQISSTQSGSHTSGSEDTTQDVLVMIQGKETVEEVTATLAPVIVQKLSKFLSVSPSHFEVSKPLHAYGVDSLIASELRNWFLKVLKIEVSVFEILGGSSAYTLSNTVAHKYPRFVKG